MIAFTISNGGLKWGTNGGLSHGYCGSREVNGRVEAWIFSAGHIPFVRLDSNGEWASHTINNGSGAISQASYHDFQDTLLTEGFGI